MFVYPKEYDVLVVGAGHAGIEASLAAARMGCQTLLLSLNLDSIGQMSCNPAVGGLAKGHLVREIDALGGEMGKATDMAGLQFRMLNTKKGPSVWAPRAQCDKKAYQARMKWVCERQLNLDTKQGHVVSVVHNDGKACGVETDLGVRYLAETVIVTTGTFLRGLMHIGSTQCAGGRSGEAAATALSNSLRELGLELGRLKTGTPPRLLKRTIDFSRTEVQQGEEPIPFFSFWKDELFHVEHGVGEVEQAAAYPPASVLERIGGQLPCHITYTTKETGDLINRNLGRSPLYAGRIEGLGPRYCPSIEDKIVRFSEKERHQVFLEPEGVSTDEIYVNGLSTSLPIDVQLSLVRSLVGCEGAEITRPAYAVEYDSASPTQLHPSLESKCLSNLYLAGQINGTSGYEEAAAQGLMAGLNAARRVRGQPPIVLRRDQAYIGVLIDDIISKKPTEPYRLFSSRAEFRLLLRQDNADLRLSDVGHQVGLLPVECHRAMVQKRTLVEQELKRLASTQHGTLTLAQILKRPEIKYSNLPNRNDALPEDVQEQVEISLKYEGYIDRQEKEVSKLKSMENKRIPDWIDYTSILGLGAEAKQELSRVRPETIGQASRIAGVTPSDVALLLVRMKAAVAQ